MPTRDEVAQLALTLPADDRAILVDLLIRSLSGDFASPEIEAAWMEEIERRAQAYERGEMEAEDWQVVMSRLQAKLGSPNT